MSEAVAVDPIIELLGSIIPPFLLRILTDPVLSKAVLAIYLGIAFGRGIGKSFDQDLQKTPFFKKQEPFWQNRIKNIMDVLHHWQYGWILLVVFGFSSFWGRFGIGLIIDDLPDIPFRYGWRERPPLEDEDDH